MAEHDVENIVQNVDLNKGLEAITFLSETLTEKITEIITDLGLTVTTRWTSTLLLFVSISLIVLSLKITKPFLKWGLIILGVILTLGLIIPW